MSSQLRAAFWIVCGNVRSQLRHKTILQTCDNWDTDYNPYNWESEFMTIFVTWQSRVTVDSIRNSCDVFVKTFLNEQVQGAFNYFWWNFVINCYKRSLHLLVQHIFKPRIGLGYTIIFWGFCEICFSCLVSVLQSSAKSLVKEAWN